MDKKSKDRIKLLMAGKKHEFIRTKKYPHIEQILNIVDQCVKIVANDQRSQKNA